MAARHGLPFYRHSTVVTVTVCCVPRHTLADQWTMYYTLENGRYIYCVRYITLYIVCVSSKVSLSVVNAFTVRDIMPLMVNVNVNGGVDLACLAALPLYMAYPDDPSTRPHIMIRDTNKDIFRTQDSRQPQSQKRNTY